MTRQQPNRVATYAGRRLEIINSRYPGGVVCMCADYISGKYSVKEIARICGIDTGPVAKVLRSKNIALRGVQEASIKHYQAHPERAVKVSRAHKVLKVCNRPDVRARATATRKLTNFLNPSTHPNFLAKMTKWEEVVAQALTVAGIKFEFNKSAPPYWLDFYLTDRNIGLEIQRSSRPNNKNRDLDIRSTLQLKNILYFATEDVQRGLVSNLIHLIQDIDFGRFDPTLLGEYTMLRCKKYGAGIFTCNGYNFRWSFGTASTKDRPPFPKVG